MKKYFAFFTSGLLIAISIPALAFGPGGDSMGNGGDVVASEFIMTARSVIQTLIQMPLSPDLMTKVQTLSANVSVVVVHSADGLLLSGVAVDAINYPANKQIMVDRARWMQNPNVQSLDTKRLVLHEYLGVSGFDDSTYLISGSLTNTLRAQDLKQFVSLQQSLQAFDVLLKGMMQNFQSNLQSSDVVTAKNNFCQNLQGYDDGNDATYNALEFDGQTLTNDGVLNVPQILKDMANSRMQIGFICNITTDNPNELYPLLSQIEIEVANMLNVFSP